MAAAVVPPSLEFDGSRPLDMNKPGFHEHKYEWYRWMLEEAPVCVGKISVLKVNLVSRYEDCRMVLSDDRFVRNRGRAKGRGSSPMPFPMPKFIAAVARSMILEDEPEHRRLRNLVNKAFTPRAVGRLSDRVEELSYELLDELGSRNGPIDLLDAYARPMPKRVIAEMMGISKEGMEPFQNTLSVLTKGMSGYGLIRTLLWDLRRVAGFVRELVAKKRADSGDDILSRLIEAEEEGERLSEDELVAMVFLLIVAGFETTLHLITNGVNVLLEHPAALERLRSEPELWTSAVEEIVRYRGPIHGTKLQYAAEDVTLHGVTIKRGAPVMPMLAAANHDPRAFEKPEEFDIVRSPNHHLGFGFGRHFCLGRQLALMETRVALQNVFARFPNLRLAVDPGQLEIACMPGWHRYEKLPVALG